jgi:hypothetical protein
MKAIVSRRILSGGLMAMAAMVVLGGCAVAPTSPTVMVLPGTQKSPGQFQADASACQLEAQNFVAPLAQAANNQAASNVVIGTVVGAAAGALARAGFLQSRRGRRLGRGYRHAGGQCRRGREFAGLVVQPATAIQLRLHAVHVSARPSGAWSTGVPQPGRPGLRHPRRRRTIGRKRLLRRATRRRPTRRRCIRRRILRRLSLRSPAMARRWRRTDAATRSGRGTAGAPSL